MRSKHLAFIFPIITIIKITRHIAEYFFWPMFSLMKAYIKYNLMNTSEAYKNKEYTSSALLGYNLCDTVHIKVVRVS